MAVNNFPSQKKRAKQKGTAWRQDHFSWAKAVAFTESSPTRSTVARKDRNIKSYLGHVDIKEYAMLLNPNGLKKFRTPKQIQHHPIAVPYMNVLIGEEFDRYYNWRCVLTNPDSIAQIDNDKKKMMADKVKQVVTDQSLSPEEAMEELKKYDKYLNYKYQDIREKRSNLLLKHYTKELDLRLKFNEGFKDVLLHNEEGYIGEVFNGRPSIEKLDSLKTFVIRSGDSRKYEDADVIITYDYIPPGKAQDLYYKYLTDADTKTLDSVANKLDIGKGTELDRDEHGINIARREMMRDYISMPGKLGSSISSDHSQITDEFGNIRRIRLFWKSKKMVKRVKSYDEITGKPVYSYESEHYIARTDMGEEVEEYWVSQWWEGVELHDEIYPYIRPREIQFNKFDDPGYNHPGIVGQMYGIDSYQGSSMMDMAMPYQLIYDATFHRLQDAMSKFFGSLVVVDYASLPAGWDIDKWMFFAKNAGIAVKDSFKEGTKGMATGKLAGGMPNSGQSINQQLGDYIQQQINILNYVENQLGRIVGVPPQRLGEIQNRETVGGVERAVTQSSFITNERFQIHDNVKKRVLMMLLELCKVAYKGSKTRFQYLTDEYIMASFEIDDDFVNEDYGIIVDNDSNTAKIEQMLEQVTQQAIQSQMIRYSDLFKFYNTSSLVEKQRILEEGEQHMMERADEQNKAQSEQVQAEMKQRQDEAQLLRDMEEKHFGMKQELEYYKIDTDAETKRMAFENKEGSEPESDEEAGYREHREKLQLEYDKLDKELLFKMKGLSEQIRTNKANEAINLKKASQKPKATAKK